MTRRTLAVAAIAGVAASVLCGRRTRTGPVRSSRRPPDDRQAHRHRAPVGAGLVARQSAHRVHVGARGCREPLRRPGGRIRQARHDHGRCGRRDRRVLERGQPARSISRAAAQLMQASADGNEVARPALPQGQFRGVTPSPDGTRIAYLVGGRAAAAGGRSRARRRRAQAPPAAQSTAARDRPGRDSRAARSRTARRRRSRRSPARSATVTWMADGERLTFTSGGGGQTIRHEQTPEYSGDQDHLHGHGERARAAGRVYLVAGRGRHARESQRAGRRAAAAAARDGWTRRTCWSIARRPNFKRRSIFRRGRERPATQSARARRREDDVLEHSRRRGRGLAGVAGRQVDFVPERPRRLGSPLCRGGSRDAPARARRRRGASRSRKGPFEAWRPAWSPDGTRIAFDSNEGTNPGSGTSASPTIRRPAASAAVRMVTNGRGTNTAADLVAGRPQDRLSAYRSAELRRPVRRRRGDAGREARPAHRFDARRRSTGRAVRRAAARALSGAGRQARAGVSVRAEERSIAP